MGHNNVSSTYSYYGKLNLMVSKKGRKPLDIGFPPYLYIVLLVIIIQ